jgi:predicted ester cyclase
MSAEENKAKVRAYWEEGINQGSLAAVDDLVAPNEIVHTVNNPNGLNTPETAKKFIVEIRAAFPDAQVTVEDLVAEGDRVVNRVTIRGTQTGELNEPPVGRLSPTGRQITYTAIAINRFADGKSVEVWSVGDDLGFWQQLGVIPALSQKDD